jgi:hypothetical protein
MVAGSALGRGGVQLVDVGDDGVQLVGQRGPFRVEVCLDRLHADHEVSPQLLDLVQAHQALQLVRGRGYVQRRHESAHGKDRE